MMTQALLDYLKQQLGQGVTKERLTSTLLARGWQPSDIEEAFVKLSSPAFSASAVTSLPGPSSLLRQAWVIYRRKFKTFCFL